MDWTTLLRAQQADFIQRLKAGCLLRCEIEGQHSELTVISGKRLNQLRDFCWEMVKKYKPYDPKLHFINNMKGKLGEEVVKARLGNLVTEVDYEKRFGGDGKVDFALTSDPSVGIQVKVRNGSIDTVQWSISLEEVKKNVVLVCILIQEEVNEAQSEYNLILAGFLPTNMIKLTNGKKMTNAKACIGLDELLYFCGLRTYLDNLKHLEISNHLPEEVQSSILEQECKQTINENKDSYLERQLLNLLIDYCILGCACYEKQDYQGAISHYCQALQINPYLSEAYFYRSISLSSLGDIQGAIEDINKAIIINPVDEKLYSFRGFFHENLGDEQRAIKDFTQAIRMNSNDDYIYFRRGRIFSKIGDKKAAINDYNQSLVINPKAADVYFSCGYVQYLIRDTQNAIEDFTQAIKINPKLAQAYFWRGVARFDKRVDQGSIVDFTQVIKLDPNCVKAYVRRGITLIEIKEYQKAINDFDTAIKIDINCAEAYENRGFAYYKLGVRKHGIQDLQIAANLYQEHSNEEDFQRVIEMLKQTDY